VSGAPPGVNASGHECWIVETSRDGERWRVFGRTWKFPGERLSLHAAGRFVRYRPDGDPKWREPLEQTDDVPMELLDVENDTRRDMWPDESYLGVPVLLSGGETGRLLSFEHETDPDRWTYALRFEGSRE
jgi:hypothetical protein